jgi:peptidoglycan/xylan/chitin deacetylase (PgdA/CDA1 family)
LAPSAIQDELAGCKRQLEEIVGRQIDLFAYPYGHYDRRVRKEVARAGYRAGFSFLNGRVTAGLDRFRLPRLNMWQGQGVLRLAYHLARPPSSWPDTQLGTVADAASEPGALEHDATRWRPPAVDGRGRDHEDQGKDPTGT